MNTLVQSLMVCALLLSVKQEMIERWPDYAAQINQAGVPSIEYRHHGRLAMRGWLLGHCDVTDTPQIWIVVDRRIAVTAYRLRHEFEHFIVQAAGIPVIENKRIDSQQLFLSLKSGLKSPTVAKHGFLIQIALRAS